MATVPGRPAGALPQGVSPAISIADDDALRAAVLRATSDAVWVLDEEGRTLWSNSRLADLLGGTDAAALDLNFFDFSTDDAAAQCFQTCTTQRAEQRREMSFGRKGTIAWADVRVLPFGRYASSANATLVMITDVTAERAAESAMRRATEDLEERLRGDSNSSGPGQPAASLRHEERLLSLTAQIVAANKELEAFSYSVSHDLREPLRSIDGFSRILLDRYANVLDERGQDYLGRVCAAAQRMGRLIADMLTLARIARAEMSLQPVDITALARPIFTELAEANPNRKVKVTVADGLNAVGDPRLMAVVLTNLIGNAWKFTSRRADATIELTACPSGTDDVFRIADNGAGFEMKYVEKLFRPFQRLHTDADFMGTGIGLATVQRIVARHGGRVWAEAVVDHGAQVCFSIPRPPKPEAGSTKASAS